MNQYYFNNLIFIIKIINFFIIIIITTIINHSYLIKLIQIILINPYYSKIMTIHQLIIIISPISKSSHFNFNFINLTIINYFLFLFNYIFAYINLLHHRNLKFFTITIISPIMFNSFKTIN